MAKKKAELSKLGNETKATHLKRLHPFLNREFRLLKKTELNEKTFKELFPGEDYQPFKLDAIWQLQQCDTKTRETLTTEHLKTLATE